MVNCSYCKRLIDGLPYKCKYCGGVYCVEHHLPENHECEGLRMARSPDQIEKESISFTWYPKASSMVKAASGAAVYPRELLSLTVATLAVALAFSFPYTFQRTVTALLIATLVYVPHELAHKFAAHFSGLRATFTLHWPGLVVTLLSMLPYMPLRLAFPGYVAIEGIVSDTKTGGKIAAAGPLMNLALCSLLALLPSSYSRSLLFASAMISILNLLPLPPLDGSKIIKWNIGLWALMVIASVIFIFTTI